MIHASTERNPRFIRFQHYRPIESNTSLSNYSCVFRSTYILHSCVIHWDLNRSCDWSWCSDMLSQFRYFMISWLAVDDSYILKRIEIKLTSVQTWLWVEKEHDLQKIFIEEFSWMRGLFVRLFESVKMNYIGVNEIFIALLQKFDCTFDKLHDCHHQKIPIEFSCLPTTGGNSWCSCDEKIILYCIVQFKLVTLYWI